MDERGTGQQLLNNLKKWLSWLKVNLKNEDLPSNR
jgi:hypothetical protein